MQWRAKKVFGLMILLAMLATGTALVLYALRQNINLFYTPSQIHQGQAPMNQTIRVGGMVKQNSLLRGEGLALRFTVTDFEQTLVIHYQGILPDLFREGQGVVVLGKLSANNTFQAHQILAKHDEKYMPPEVAKMVKKD